MPVYQAGSLNTSALTAPDLYVQVIAPKTRYINGVATDGLGLVGIGSWGPVNSAFLIGSDTDQALYLGSPQVRKYDLATAAAISLQLGASNLHCVRVTDGTDVAASVALKDVASTTRKGMYALRGTNSQVMNLVDLTDSSAWPTMATFATAEGSYGISQGASGTTYSALSTLLNNAGVDDWHFKAIVGDWPYWKDTVNGVNRMISPATFEAANIAARSPHISTLNKRISNIIATQRQLANQPYSTSEIGAINSARLDVITNPCPGGNYFGMRSGRNCSSVQSQNDDTYTRMTNYLSLTIAASFGDVVGQNHTLELRRETKSTLESFLSNLELQGMIGDPNGGAAFSVKIDASNNTDSQVALGYMVADVQVKYLNVVRYFLVNLEGGGSVTIAVPNNPSS
ncbi:phage tail protein [Pantoea endophytica]